MGATGEVPIPLHNVKLQYLRTVVRYCEHHVTDAPTAAPPPEEKSKDRRSDWDKEFCKMDNQDLFELILAANYLDVKPLLDCCCFAVADMIKGKTPEEIRKTFNIKNDFTPEEEERLRKENEWCEER